MSRLSVGLKSLRSGLTVAAVTATAFGMGARSILPRVRANDTLPCEQRCSEAKSRCASACAQHMEATQCQPMCENMIKTCYSACAMKAQGADMAGGEPQAPRGGSAGSESPPPLAPGARVGLRRAVMKLTWRADGQDTKTAGACDSSKGPCGFGEVASRVTTQTHEMIEATIEMKVPDLPYDGSEGANLAFSLAGTTATGPAEAQPHGGRRIPLPNTELVSLVGRRSFSRDVDGWKKAIEGGEGSDEPYECRSVSTDRGSAPIAIGDVVMFNFAFSPRRGLAQLVASPLKVNHESKSTCPAVLPSSSTFDQELNASLAQPATYVLAGASPAMAALGNVPGCSFAWKKEGSDYQGSAHCVRDGGKGYTETEDFAYAIEFP